MTTPAWNIAVMRQNLADAGTITASGSITQAPPSLLQNKHVGKKWQVNATSAYVVCDLGSVQSPDTLTVVGMSGASPTLRVRASTADSSGVAGDAYDSGSLSGAWDSNYLPFVNLMTLSAPARYFRIDIAEGGVPYIAAGRLAIGARAQFAINFQPGWERAWNDPTVKTIGRGGQTFDDLRDKYRSLNLTLDFMPEDDRWNIVEAIDLALGTSGDMLVMVDPSSSNLSRDSLWGYFDGIDPVSEPVIVSDQRFRRTYKIRERL